MATCPMCQGQFEGATFCPKDGTRLETEAGAAQLLGGRYRLIRRVGEGAMGVVFEAEHVHIHRRVAVKLLQRKLAANAEAVERMRREAQAMSGVGHPNIVDCTDFGVSDDGQVYLVMEWLEGENLEERLTRSPVDLVTALDIATQACAGLAEAHAQGVIHRDLKPANLFLTLDRVGALCVKVLDFGIAKLGAEQAQLTSTGVVIGTPNYMAPEQALGERIDLRADIYALGIILYEMLVGVVPFQADTPLAVLHQHTARMPALPSAAAPARGISPELDAITMTCLAKDPAERYQTATELGAAIEQVRTIDKHRKAPTPRVSQPPAPELQAGDSRDDLAVLRRSGRTRWIILVIVAAAVIATAAIVLVLRAARTDHPPQLADAALVAKAPDSGTLPNDAGSAIDSMVTAVGVDSQIGVDGQGTVDAPFMRSDAATVDASAAANRTDASSVPIEDPSAVIRKIERRYTLEARFEPRTPVAGESTALVLVVVRSSLDAAQRVALDNGEVHVQVSIEHFVRHDHIHHSTVVLDPQGGARITFVPRAGKHHVSVEPSIDGRDLGLSRFDVNAR